MKKKNKSMSPKQILAYIAFIIAIVWTLKFVFELSSSGVKQITSSGSKQVTSSSGGKICYYPKTYFEGDAFTGEYVKEYKEKYKAKFGPSSSYCHESNWSHSTFTPGLPYFRCETTSAYKKFAKKYEKCRDSGGKNTLEFSMRVCELRSVDVASEIRGEWYRDCMRGSGW